MKRWHLTLGLAGASLAAALLVPSLRGTAPLPSPTPTVDPVPSVGPVPVEPVVAEVVSVEAGALSVTARLDQDAVLLGSTEDRFLVVEVTAASPDAATVRQPVHLSLVLDTSGSMAAAGKISHARTAAAELVGLLGPEDTFSLVTFDDRAEVMLPDRPVLDGASLARRVHGIRTGGGTNLFDGLRTGLEQAMSSTSEGVRRVVVLSDGKANIGVTDSESLRRQAGLHAGEGVTVSAVGLGLDYNEDLLAAMADAGGGSYRFVDRPAQLTEMFTEELQQASSVVAQQTTLTLELPEGIVLEEVFGYSWTGDQVFLGDLYAGETRKLVARVQVPTRSVGAVEVARVAVEHRDAESGSRHRAQASVSAHVTPDAVVATRSRNKDAQKHATLAQVGSLVDGAARAFEKGDVATNQVLYEEATKLMSTYATDFDDVDLDSEVEELERQQAAFGRPSAPAAARTEVLNAKGAARDYSRR